MQDNGSLALFLATSGHSGVDRIVKNLVPAVAARGINIDVLHVKNHGPYLDDVPSGVRVVELNSAHAYTSLLPLVRYLRRERPAVLLSDKDKVNRVALSAKTLAGGTTRVAVRNGMTVSHDLAARGTSARWAHYLSMHYLYRLADAVLVPSVGAADDLARFARIARERITVVPNPVVTDEVLTRARDPVDHPWLTQPDTPVVIGVGELSTRKDFETLVRAFARVRALMPCRLMILGRGRRKEALEQLASELGINEDIALPGFVANPYAYMARASLFVHSSRYEGFGNVLVEAMAVGTPVVATDCPSGPREILDGGRFGHLVPVGDDEAMSKAIVDALNNPIPADVLQGATARFTVAASADSYLAALGLAPR